MEQLIQSRDGKFLRVVVKYVNTAEFPVLQFTDRAVRQLVKIFDVEEYVLQEDLTELLRRLDANKMDEAVAQRDGDQNPQASGGCNPQSPAYPNLKRKKVMATYR